MFAASLKSRVIPLSARCSQPTRLLSSTSVALNYSQTPRRNERRPQNANQANPAERQNHSNQRSDNGNGATIARNQKKHTAKQNRPPTPPAILTLADLSVGQIKSLLQLSLVYKYLVKQGGPSMIQSVLQSETVALLFSKRSTRTRVASETATAALGGLPVFLGKDDIQLGVNESLEDTAQVIGSMVSGIMARVGDHSEVEALAKGSKIPVINALSDLWHPTQILADMLTMYETLTPADQNPFNTLEINYSAPESAARRAAKDIDPTAPFKGKKFVWVGDVNNILNDILVSLPRLGMTVSVAAPKGYDKVDERVWKRVEEAGTADKIIITNSPAEALKDADFVATDTWISMGMEAEKEIRLKAFDGYQVTEKLCNDAGAKPDWKFLHCLPRKPQEVDDEVFYGPRSLVFPEAENRKWTTMACFSQLFGRWTI